MGFQVQGFNGTVAEVSGTGFRALRVNSRPIDYGALGSYRKSLASGVIAALTTSDCYHWRWTDATRFGVITRVTVDLWGNTTGFAVGQGRLDMHVVRGWTTDGSGGTAGTLTGNNAKLRTSMATTLLGACRISSTAALTAGTYIAPGTPMALGVWAASATVTLPYLVGYEMFNDDASIGGHPIITHANEGLVMRATTQITGTWSLGVTTSWTEVTSY